MRPLPFFDLVNISTHRKIRPMVPPVPPQLPPDSPPALQLASLFEQMMGLIHGRFANESLAVMHELGITLPQLVALHVLAHTGPCTVSFLSNTLRLSASATSHLVDRTVEKGLMGRTEDPGDRRQKRLELTSAGRLLLERLNAARINEFNAAFGSLDPGLQARLVGVFDQVVTQLRMTHPLSSQETE